MSRFLCSVTLADGFLLHQDYFNAADQEAARKQAAEAWGVLPGFVSVRYISSGW